MKRTGRETFLLGAKDTVLMSYHVLHILELYDNNVLFHSKVPISPPPPFS